MATHSSILVWETLWTEKPDRLQSMKSPRARHDYHAHTKQSMCWTGLLGPWEWAPSSLVLLWLISRLSLQWILKTELIQSQSVGSDFTFTLVMTSLMLSGYSKEDILKINTNVGLFIIRKKKNIKSCHASISFMWNCYYQVLVYVCISITSGCLSFFLMFCLFFVSSSFFRLAVIQEPL